MDTPRGIACTRVTRAPGQCAVYLALAPKSTAVCEAYAAAKRCALAEPQHPVPLHLRNAPTRLLRDLGWGDGYKYNPACASGEAAGQLYLPEALKDRIFFDFSAPRAADPASPAY